MLDFSTEMPVIIAATRKIVRRLGMQRLAVAALNRYVRLQPRRHCIRKGFRYDLDLTEVIDRALWLGDWEPETTDFLRSVVNKGDVVIEIGANVGAHTLLLADLVGPHGWVYAYEPTAYAQCKLRTNLALNPRIQSRVVVRSELVTNHTLATPTRNLQSSYPAVGGHPTEPVNARAVALDNETFHEGTGERWRYLLKIDVDGYDFKVLQGAAAFIGRCKPLILVELQESSLKAQGDSVWDIFKFLEGFGYQGFTENGDSLNAWKTLRRIGHASSMNGVFVTDHRLTTFT